jgi:hypothetical protein
MKTSRTSLITAAGIFAMTLFASSAQMANAGGLGLDWLSNKPYVECIKQARMLADVSSIVRGPVYREASFEQGRHQCNRRYYGHE